MIAAELYEVQKAIGVNALTKKGCFQVAKQSSKTANSMHRHSSCSTRLASVAGHMAAREPDKVAGMRHIAQAGVDRTVRQMPTRHPGDPINPDEAGYSADVTVFRAPESQGHVFLTEPFKASMIACPGLYRPQVDNSGRLTAKMVQQLEQKLDLILKLAACFGHDSIILEAMGCGGMYACSNASVQYKQSVPADLCWCTMQHGRILQQMWQQCLRASYRKIAGDCSRS